MKILTGEQIYTKP